MTVHAVGLDGGLVACSVGEINLDHLGRIVGRRVTVGVRAHFESGLDFGGGKAKGEDE